MSETKTVIGTLGGILEKSGEWRQIQVSVPGKQYPVKMDTKKEELVQLARAAGENVMAWTYSESDSGNPNPHRPGENYVNRYFEGVAPVSEAQAGDGASSVPASGPAAPQTGMSKEEWAAKDSAIHQMACLKAAADALKHTIPSDPSDEDLKKFNERVQALAGWWHNVVLAVREGEDAPF